jgi:hypothetical protein
MIIEVLMTALRLIEKAMDGQPPEVRAELWRMFLEDLRAWRTFWEKVGNIFEAPQPGKRERKDEPA